MTREIDKVVEIVGSQAALAKALGISSNAVSKWVAQGYVPPARAVVVAKLVAKHYTLKGEKVSLESLLLEATQK